VTPRLSIILPAILGFEPTLAAIDAWRAQTCASDLEILVLCPDADQVAPSAGRGCVLIRTGELRLHEARALAIRRATGEFIVLAEDHCLPEPDWCDAVRARLAEGWDVVGPVLRPGNRRTTSAQAAFLLGYGEWMMPVASGPAAALPGHNVAVRRAPLVAMGEDLERRLLVAAFLLRRLREQGLRFYIEDRARMRHFDPSGWATTLRIFAWVGMGFGAVRTSGWAQPLRFIYLLAAPAVAARHWQRAFTHYRRVGADAGISSTTMIVAAAFALAWGAGEALGAVAGVEKVTPHLWQTEVKPVAAALAE
jgi:hypothetical protein